jgi:uncharacterized protein YgfB (UPF0149 family)
MLLDQRSMENSSSLPSYSEMITALQSEETPFLPAQAHGYICGLLCGTSGKIDNSWQNKILGDQKKRRAREMLQEVFETSYHLISEFSFEFTLILPDDKADINLRTEGLGSWCQGFLSGLKQCRIPLEDREPGEVTDALSDITEIANVNFGDIKTTDEDEMAYFELVEYVRLAVLMIFHEFSTPNAEDSIDNGNWTH